MASQPGCLMKTMSKVRQTETMKTMSKVSKQRRGQERWFVQQKRKLFLNLDHEYFSPEHIHFIFTDGISVRDSIILSL